MIKWPHTFDSEASLERTTWKVDFIRRTGISALFRSPLPRSRSFGVLPFVCHSSRARKSRELRCDLEKSVVDERADNRCARAQVRGVWNFALSHHAQPLPRLLRHHHCCPIFLPAPLPLAHTPSTPLSSLNFPHEASIKMGLETSKVIETIPQPPCPSALEDLRRAGKCAIFGSTSYLLALRQPC